MYKDLEMVRPQGKMSLESRLLLFCRILKTQMVVLFKLGTWERWGPRIKYQQTTYQGNFALGPHLSQVPSLKRTTICVLSTRQNTNRRLSKEILSWGLTVPPFAFWVSDKIPIDDFRRKFCPGTGASPFPQVPVRFKEPPFAFWVSDKI